MEVNSFFVRRTLNTRKKLHKKDFFWICSDKVSKAKKTNIFNKIKKKKGFCFFFGDDDILCALMENKVPHFFWTAFGSNDSNFFLP